MGVDVDGFFCDLGVDVDGFLGDLGVDVDGFFGDLGVDVDGLFGDLGVDVDGFFVIWRGIWILSQGKNFLRAGTTLERCAAQFAIE